MSNSFHIIKPLLLKAGSHSSRILSFAGLATGVLLLFCCVQMYFNLQQLTKKNSIRKNGYDYIAIRKSVTNETIFVNILILFSSGDFAEI